MASTTRKKIKKARPKSITVPLQFPLSQKNGKQTVKIEGITMGRLKAKHFEMLPDSFFDGDGKDVKPQEIIPLIAALSGLDNELVKELDFVDLEAVCTRLLDFLA